MQSLIKISILSCLIAVLLVAVAAGQDELPKEEPQDESQDQIKEEAQEPPQETPEEAPQVKPRGKFSLGVGGGVFWPVGEWADHRYAPVKQFSTDFTVEFILEYRVGSWAAFALTGGGGAMGTDKWVNYAWSQGDVVTSSASLYLFSFLFRPYLLQRPNQILKLDFGIGSFAAHGNESFLYFNYDYDFLQSKFSFITGAEYCFFVKPKLALAAHINLIYVDGGVKYADEYSQSVMGFPMTVGIRFYP